MRKTFKRTVALLVIATMLLSVIVTLSACGTKKFKVTFDLNYENAPSSKVIEVEDGKTAQKPEEDPTREGFEFAFWGDAATATTEFDFSTAISANKTLYAIWNEASSSADLYPEPGEIVATLTGTTYRLDVYSSRVSKIFKKDSDEFVKAFQNHNTRSIMGGSGASIEVVFGEWASGTYEYICATATGNNKPLVLEYNGDTLSLEGHSELTSYSASSTSENTLQFLGGHTEVQGTIEKDGLISSYFNAGGRWTRTNVGFWTISQKTKGDYTKDSVTFEVYMDGIKRTAGVDDANRIFADLTATISTFTRSGIVSARQVEWVPALFGDSVPLFSFGATNKAAQLYLGGIDKGEGVAEGNLLKIVNTNVTPNTTIIEGEWKYNAVNNKVTLTLDGNDIVPTREGAQWTYNTLEFTYDGIKYSSEIINWESMLLEEYPTTMPTGVVTETITGKSSSGASNAANYTLLLYGNNKAYFSGITNDGVITLRGSGTYVKTAQACDVTITDREYGSIVLKFTNNAGTYSASINLDEKAGLTANQTSNRILGDLTLSYSEVSYKYQGLVVGGNLNRTIIVAKFRANGKIEVQDYKGGSHSGYGTYTYDSNKDEYTIEIKDSTTNAVLYSGTTTKKDGIYSFSYAISSGTAKMTWTQTAVSTGIVFTCPGPYSQTIVGTLYTDGSMTVSVGMLGTASGNWSYNDETNVYSYTCIDANGDGNGRSGDSTYDADTGTYSLSYTSMSTAYAMKYTPAK